jgi:hypothetical protein
MDSTHMSSRSATTARHAEHRHASEAQGGWRHRLRLVTLELAHHLPYTVISSLIAMVVVWWFSLDQAQHFGGSGWESEVRWSFHVLHPLHVCLSAITTTAVFWRAERRLLRTILVGGFGSVIPCGLSDYIVPFVGGRVLGQAMELHICLLEHPMVVLPFLVLGIVAGFLLEQPLSGGSVFSHGAHVFVSSLAALVYLVSYGFTGWLTDITLVFPVLFVVVMAVWVPCCMSDIVIPVSALSTHSHGRHRPFPRATV